MQKPSRRGSMRGSELSIFIHDAGAPTAIPQEMQEVAALAWFGQACSSVRVSEHAPWLMHRFAMRRSTMFQMSETQEKDHTFPSDPTISFSVPQ